MQFETEVELLQLVWSTCSLRHPHALTASEACKHTRSVRQVLSVTSNMAYLFLNKVKSKQHLSTGGIASECGGIASECWGIASECWGIAPQVYKQSNPLLDTDMVNCFARCEKEYRTGFAKSRCWLVYMFA